MEVDKNNRWKIKNHSRIQLGNQRKYIAKKILKVKGMKRVVTNFIIMQMLENKLGNLENRSQSSVNEA